MEDYWAAMDAAKGAAVAWTTTASRSGVRRMSGGHVFHVASSRERLSSTREAFRLRDEHFHVPEPESP